MMQISTSYQRDGLRRVAFCLCRKSPKTQLREGQSGTHSAPPGTEWERRRNEMDEG